MGDSEPSSPSTSSASPNKRPAEPDPDASDQEPALKQANNNKKKANSTSIHEEFTRYKYATEGGEERVGSKCNECGFLMKDINPTNLKLHYKRKHQSIFERVIG